MTSSEGVLSCTPCSVLTVRRQASSGESPHSQMWRCIGFQLHSFPLWNQKADLATCQGCTCHWSPKPISPAMELQPAKLQSAQRGRLCLCRASKHHDGKLPIPNLPNILSVFVLCPMLVKSCCWGILFKEVLWEEEQPAENVRNAMHKQGEPYSHQFIAQMESGRLKVFGSGRQTYSRKNIWLRTTLSSLELQCTVLSEITSERGVLFKVQSIGLGRWQILTESTFSSLEAKQIGRFSSEESWSLTRRERELFSSVERRADQEREGAYKR